MNKIRFSNLDFDGIKSSLITYLKSTDEFKDYNFEGSGMAVFLNTLSYNAHYQSLMANFLANEMFLDTAVKRSSIVSRAKELGYVPKSRTAAQATVTVEFRNVTGNPSSLVLPSGTSFAGQIDNDTYTFTTLTEYSTVRLIEDTGAVYRFSNVQIYEGVAVQNTIVYDPIDYTVSIPNKDIDISSLRVFVQDTNSSTFTEYNRNFNFLTLTDTSPAFFVQEGFNEFYEFYFGDNIIGLQPAKNTNVKFTYLVTSGIDGNYATDFMITLIPNGTETSTISVLTVATSIGGTERETNDKIRLSALNSYGTQNRAVIAEDYQTIISESGINVKNVIVWGGEDNNPPKYGFIMACVQPLVGDVLTTNQQDQIATLVKSKAVGNPRIQFIDPYYLDLIVNTSVIYNKSLLSIGTYELENNVKSTILTFAETYLSNFGDRFRISNLQTAIDNTDNSLLNNVTKVSLEKWEYPTLYISYQNKIDFSNEITSVSTSGFYVPNNTTLMNIEDSSGTLNIVYYIGNKKIIHQADVGTVDYVNGIVQINGITITSYIDSAFKIKATLLNEDILTSKNVLLRVQSGNISVSSKADV